MLWREFELVLDDAELLSEKPEKDHTKNKKLSCVRFASILQLIFENVSWKLLVK